MSEHDQSELLKQLAGKQHGERYNGYKIIDAKKVDITDESNRLAEGAYIINNFDGNIKRVINDSNSLDAFNLGDLVRCWIEINNETPTIDEFNDSPHGSEGIVVGKRYIDDVAVYNMIVVQHYDGRYLYEPRFLKKIA
ncbi:MAG: hypothetical protein ACW98D_18555 [Promethearchaeota archaeon]|jgi:hypothetical protein